MKNSILISFLLFSIINYVSPSGEQEGSSSSRNRHVGGRGSRGRPEQQMTYQGEAGTSGTETMINFGDTVHGENIGTGNYIIPINESASSYDGRDRLYQQAWQQQMPDYLHDLQEGIETTGTESIINFGDNTGAKCEIQQINNFLYDDTLKEINNITFNRMLFISSDNTRSKFV
jgi:hypothetical protein